MFFCRTLIFYVLTPVLLFTLMLGRATSSEVSFTGQVNGKEFRLTWEKDFSSPKIYITRGLKEGYPLVQQDGLWQVELAGDHRISVRVNKLNEASHIVLREERRGKYFYFAWSELIGVSNGIFTHNLYSFDDLPRESSLESAVGQGFDFKKVMRVPHTDKFIELPVKSQKSLLAIQCEYLSKLMGTPAATRDCLAYSRMSSLLSQLSIPDHSCSNILYNNDLSFRGLWDKRDNFESCLKPITKISTACLRGHLTLGRSLLRCEHKLNSTSQNVSDTAKASEYLAQRLESITPALVAYRDESLNHELSVQLSNERERKLVLAHCYYQYLSNAQSRTDFSEAFDSCVYSESTSYSHPQRDLRAATSQWLVNKAMGGASSTLPAKNLDLAENLGLRLTPAEAPAHLDLPLLGHARQSLTGHYRRYAQYLLSRGWLLRALQAPEELGLRAPASVSK